MHVKNTNYIKINIRGTKDETKRVGSNFINSKKIVFWFQ